MDTEGSCGLQVCLGKGGVGVGVGEGGCDSKVASLTPQTIWGPHGRWECGWRMKSTLVPATPRLEWPYVRFSDTGQLPLNPAVWGAQNMMFISQEGLTGCANGRNCKDDSGQDKVCKCGL